MERAIRSKRKSTIISEVIMNLEVHIRRRTYRFQTQQSEVSEGRMQDLMDRVRDLDERFVRFGPTVDLEPDQLQGLRTRLAEQLSSE